MPLKGGLKGEKTTKPRKRRAPTAPHVVRFPDVGSGKSEEEGDDALPVRVQLVVGGDAQFAAKVKRLCEKHFRRLPNVVLTDDSSMFLINISALLDDTGRFCLSHFIGAKVVTLLEAFESFQILRDTAIGAMFQSCLDVTEHGLAMGPVEALEEACADIAKKFAGEYVTPMTSVGEMIMKRFMKGGW